LSSQNRLVKYSTTTWRNSQSSLAVLLFQTIARLRLLYSPAENTPDLPSITLPRQPVFRIGPRSPHHHARLWSFGVWTGGTPDSEGGRDGRFMPACFMPGRGAGIRPFSEHICMFLRLSNCPIRFSSSPSLQRVSVFSKRDLRGGESKLALCVRWCASGPDSGLLSTAGMFTPVSTEDMALDSFEISCYSPLLAFMSLEKHKYKY